MDTRQYPEPWMADATQGSRIAPYRLDFPPPGQVAQLVEQRTENPRVGGSTPSLATLTVPSSEAPPSCGPVWCAVSLVARISVCSESSVQMLDGPIQRRIPPRPNVRNRRAHHDVRCDPNADEVTAVGKRVTLGADPGPAAAR
jgi:hypothetical protein